MEPFDPEHLIKNLFTEEYSKQRILECLAYMERTPAYKRVMLDMFKMYQPEYYIPDNHWTGEGIKVCTLILELKLNEL